MNTKNIGSKIVIGFVLGIIVYALFLLLGDIKQIKSTLSSFSFQTLLFFGALTYLSYFVRYAKWSYLLKYMNINIPFKDNLTIFFIGIAMTITPGKIGELLKSYLMKKKYGIEMTKTAPVVIVDRLTDLFSMVLLISWGLTLFSFGYALFTVIAAFLLGILLILRIKPWCNGFIDQISKLKPISKHKEKLKDTYEITYQLLAFKPLCIATLLSLISWFIQCLPLFFIFRHLDLPLQLPHAVFTFTAGTLLGALSMVPGGFGVTEGSVSGMLVYFGIEKGQAVSVTLLMNGFALWLGVITGVILLIKEIKKGHL
jgi:uncharacterized protein (TIRG00374 family)